MRVFMCMRVFLSMNKYMQPACTYECTYMCVCIHAYANTHICMQRCKHRYIHTYAYSCQCTLTHVSTTPAYTSNTCATRLNANITNHTVKTRVQTAGMCVCMCMCIYITYKNTHRTHQNNSQTQRHVRNQGSHIFTFLLTRLESST